MSNATVVPADELPVTADTLAAELRCSVKTIYRLAAAKKLPGFRVGRSWRFYRSAVRAALDPKPVDTWARPAGSTRARKGAR